MSMVRHALMVAFMGLLTLPAVGTEGSYSLMQVIGKIETATSQQERHELSVQLVNIVIVRKDRGLSEAELHELASLLENPDDSVRLYTASALGVLGPSARSAVPALRKAEEKVKCQYVEFSSQATILFALEKITGVRQELPMCDH